MFEMAELQKNLTRSEFILLELLLAKKGKIVSRDEIAHHVYPNENVSGVSNEAIDQIVSRLRKSLKKEGKLIKTKTRIGYYLEAQSANKKLTREGSLVVFYGSSKVGKSTQIIKIIDKLSSTGHQSFIVVKYPIYSLQPTGPLIYDVLHKNIDTPTYNSLEFQKLYAQNRIDFQHILNGLLKVGINVIAEGYSGTGIAKGLTWGLDLRDLENINFGITQPACSILLDGKRHKEKLENGNVFEEEGQNLREKNSIEYKFLADRYGWNIIDANGDPEEIHKKVWDVVNPFFKS